MKRLRTALYALALPALIALVPTTPTFADTSTIPTMGAPTELAGPLTPPATLTTAAMARVEFHHPNMPLPNSLLRSLSTPNGLTQSWLSNNWSGYAMTGSAFTSITGRWTVPAVAASTGNTYSSNWIGIDGFNNSNLIQIGTESDFYGGAQHYGAWWEILPAPETVIPSITVHPGDTMSALISKATGASWIITITDITNGQRFSTVQTYTGPETSAEWIEEAPSYGCDSTDNNCKVYTLAHYGMTTFDPGTVNGANPNLTTSESGVMIQNNQQVSTPSVPDLEGDGFTVAYGSRAPAPPHLLFPRGAPVVVANSSGGLSVFLLGNDRALYRYDQSGPGGPWTAAQSMGGQ